MSNWCALFQLSLLRLIKTGIGIALLFAEGYNASDDNHHNLKWK